MRILLILIFVSATFIQVQSQSLEDKMNHLIDYLSLIESYKKNDDFIESYFENPKDEMGKDRLDELIKEARNRGQEIKSELHLKFLQYFNEKEINDIYDFSQTSAFDKLWEFFDSVYDYSVEPKVLYYNE